MGTKTLETERLILRRFTSNDIQDMYNNWASDDEVTKYLMWSPHENIEVSKAYIESVIDGYSQPSTYDWGIELKELNNNALKFALSVLGHSFGAEPCAL